MGATATKAIRRHSRCIPRHIPQQMSLDIDLPTSSVEEKFWEFHATHPRVYRELVTAARLYRTDTGREKCGMSLLVGRIRWVLALDEDDEDDFFLNNNYIPFYSRLIMMNEPDLDGMFETRQSIADLTLLS
jgi:hypothetical protein